MAITQRAKRKQLVNAMSFFGQRLLPIARPIIRHAAFGSLGDAAAVEQSAAMRQVEVNSVRG
ncbi:MAG: hypothetical protein IT427_19050 [Pirellulales bacterium]|nr:hypothetical protein [Pirellulales bacterium]